MFLMLRDGSLRTVQFLEGKRTVLLFDERGSVRISSDRCYSLIVLGFIPKVYYTKVTLADQ
jgi:hypothetical protein